MTFKTCKSWLFFTLFSKAHDYAILKHEFLPDKPWFKDFEVLLDLGYQGFEKDYACKKVCIPQKKPRNVELTETQKAENSAKASERIRVEHAIGGMRRYRVLSERLRVHDNDMYDDILCVCAGL